MASHPLLTMTADEVRALRAESGMGMEECKQQLERQKVKRAIAALREQAVGGDPLLFDVLDLLNKRV